MSWNLVDVGLVLKEISFCAKKNVANDNNFNWTKEIMWKIRMDAKDKDRNSQNFLGKFERFFLTLGLKILRLLWLRVVFEVDISKS